MIDFLLGVPGKLKTISDFLTTYWTAARAAKLDYLAANVAVASTAVSNADLTPTRAAKLDNLTAAVALRSDPIISPPIAANWQTGQIAIGAPVLDIRLITDAIAGSYVFPGEVGLADVVNITGAGVLNFVAMTQSVPGKNGYLAITVDGVVLISDASYFTSGASSHVAVGCAAVGTGVDSTTSVSLDQIPFRSSLRIQYRTDSGGYCVVAWKLRRTA